MTLRWVGSHVRVSDRGVGLRTAWSNESRSRDAGEYQRQNSREHAVYLCGTPRTCYLMWMRRLCRAASFPPARFLALLEGQEHLPGPGRGEFVIGDGRDTDARAPQPEMREDALATLPTDGDTFHEPCSMSVARVTSPARSKVLHTPSRLVRRAKPAHRATWARRTLTVCDDANSGQQVIACSRCEQSPEARQRAVCGVVAKRKRSVDVNQCV